MLVLKRAGFRSVSFIDEIQEPFGRRIKQLRKARGFRQEHLAELAHITSRYLIDIEHGRYGPSFEVLHALAKALDVEVKDLFDFSELHKNP